MSALAATATPHRLAAAFEQHSNAVYSEAGYQALSAAEKHEIVWSLIEATKGKIGEGTTGMAMATSAFVESHDFTMEHYGDEIQEGRRKFIHQTGLIAQARLDTTGYESHPFTGLFRGAEHCLVRCSLAKRHSQGTSALKNNTPGIAVKVFRDGCHSGNMVAMYGVDGQHSWNFFRYPMTTAVGEATSFKTDLLGKKFALAGMFPGRNGMSDFASRGAPKDHTYGDATNFPYVVEYHPPQELSERFGDEMTDEMMQNNSDILAGHKHMKSEMSTLSPGDVLFMVKVFANPWEKENGAQPMTIGRIILKTNFVESSYSDDHLFFKHQRYEEDFVLRPSWGCPAWYALNSNGEATDEWKDRAKSVAEILKRDGAKDGVIDNQHYHFKTYPNSMIGSKVVEWMMAKELASTEEESIKLGRLIVASGILRHVTREHGFENGHLFYTFDDIGHSSVCPMKWRRGEESICPMHAKHDEFDPMGSDEEEGEGEGEGEGKSEGEGDQHLTMKQFHDKMKS